MIESPNAFWVGGAGNSITTPELAITGGVIAPTTFISKIVDAGGAIVTITPPWTGFGGLIFLIAGSTFFTWTAAGNIFALGTSTAAGRCMGFVFNQLTQKWHALSAA